MKRRTTEFAILGLLAMQPRSGYDIKQTAETALAHFWNESYGNIYPILRKLHEDGLAKRSEVESDKGPPRSVYSITADGRAEFLDWLKQPVAPVSPKNEFLLKLFFGRFITPKGLARLIVGYRDQTQAMLDSLKHVRREVRRDQSADPGIHYWDLTMDCGLNSMKSLIRWCDGAIQQLEKKKEKAK